MQKEDLTIFHSCMRILTRSQAWEPNKKQSRIVSSITIRRLMGTVMLSSFLPTHGGMVDASADAANINRRRHAAAIVEDERVGHHL